MTSGPQPLWGKYRGKVVNNIDPKFMGRIMVDVPAIEASLLNYAMPSVPYAGSGVGFYAIPPIGADVWVEFENGDPSTPIWTGCFWSNPLDVPTGGVPTPLPEIKVFKTEYATFVMNDVPAVGGVTLEVSAPAVTVPISMTFTSEGVEISCTPAKITMNPTAIELNIPASSVKLAPDGIEASIVPASVSIKPDGVVITAQDKQIEVSTAGNITISTATSNIEGSGQQVNMSALTNMKMEAGANLDLNATANLSAAATANLSLSGNTQASLESPLQTSVKGTQASLEGSAMAEVKGALVKIN